MFDKIESAKTAGVAVLPINLQFFAEDAGDSEPVDTDVSDVDVSDDAQVDTDTAQDEGANDSGVADRKPVQDDKLNATFAQMRREKEAAERRLKELEAKHQRDREIARKYGQQYGVYSEDDIAALYGHQGIRTLEDFEAAIERERFRDQGLNPDLLDQYLNKRLENHPVIQRAKEQEMNMRLMQNYEELTKEYPDLVKEPKDIPPEVWVKWNDGQNGLSLLEAYEIVNRKAIREHLVKSASQAKLNEINSKSHIKGNAANPGDLDVVNVPDDVKAVYRQMFPGITDKQIMEHYRKSKWV